ncbi:hypothetical protein QLQ85_19735 [Halomonas sp. M4R5S39]|uniref:hypothetical protein n=1 Tax=Halomonas kalidii TaxID=3043293 RepID=UPI0024A887EC|nr:hypothetical protein [Halomonas kalidii]MDI5987021.1 hypothetical protein [Halomonas kalidii]
MARSSLADLEKRLAALEETCGEPTEIWIEPPERGLAGWECMGQNAHPAEKVHRLPDESDEDLADRARECMRRMRREGGYTSPAAVYFAFDHEGVSR